MATLDEHIRHSGNFKTYRGVKAQYEKLYAEYKAIQKAGCLFSERKAQKALDTANEYYETNRTGIVLYETAERYLKDVLQARFDPKKLPPISAWQTERNKLTADKKRLDVEYKQLRTGTATIEQ